MEGQGKATMMEGDENSKGREKAAVGGSCDLILRLLSLALTLAATIVVAVDNHTKVVPLKLLAELPPVNVSVSAKWHYLSASVYFLVVNAIACTYGAFSLVFVIINKGKSRGLGLLIIVFDALMVALLFSGNGAASAVGVLGYHGNSHVKWNKVCNVFDNFCHQFAASVILSLLGSAAFLVLVLLPALRLQRRTK